MTHLMRKCERAYATTSYRASQLSPSPSTSQHFWQHMKVVQGKVKHTIIPDLTDTSTSAVARSPLEKASLLNSFFCEQTALPGAATTVPDVSSLPQNDHTFDAVRTSPKEVYDVLSKLKVGKAPRIDGIPAGLLRLCASGISSSLAAMFNVSFDTGTFPADWNKAVVIPVHKKGARDMPGNYRPISSSV